MKEEMVDFIHKAKKILNIVYFWHIELSLDQYLFNTRIPQCMYKYVCINIYIKCDSRPLRTTCMITFVQLELKLKGC